MLCLQHGFCYMDLRARLRPRALMLKVQYALSVMPQAACRLFLVVHQRQTIVDAFRPAGFAVSQLFVQAAQMRLFQNGFQRPVFAAMNLLRSQNGLLRKPAVFAARQDEDGRNTFALSSFLFVHNADGADGFGAALNQIIIGKGCVRRAKTFLIGSAAGFVSVS